MPKLRYNERSWGIDLISEINAWVVANPGAIARAGGEFGTRDEEGALFPDLLLFGEGGKSNLLLGWELKFPDTEATDSDAVRNGRRKADTLNTNAFVVWNVNVAVLYLRNEAGGFTDHRQWTLAGARAVRETVEQYFDEWRDLLHRVLRDLNELLAMGEIRPSAVLDVLQAPGFSGFIARHQSLVATSLRKASNADGKVAAILRRWWKGVASSYPNEKEPFGPAAGLVLSRWLGRIVFAHLIAGKFPAALTRLALTADTTIEDALSRFGELSAAHNYAHLFGHSDWDLCLTSSAWKELLALNELLSQLRVSMLSPDLAGEVLEAIVLDERRKVMGQFVTPPWLAELMASLALVSLEEPVADPCCGSGTIARALLEEKIRRGLSPKVALQQIWASDKHPLALHLATLSLSSSSPPGELLRVFECDISDLAVGSTIRVRDPLNGRDVGLSFPVLGAVASNLPFVRFEDNDAADSRLAARASQLLGGAQLGGRSDLYGYIAIVLGDLVRAGGKVAILLSNAWLATDAGVELQANLRRLFRFDLVLISGEARWFQNADVVTTLLVATRREPECGLAEGEECCFATTLTNPSTHDSARVQAIADSLVLKEAVPGTTTVAVVNDETERRLRAIGIGPNAYFADLQWATALEPHLVPIDDVCKVRRGERRGWDAMFFPEENNRIEPLYLVPALKTLKGAVRLSVTTDRQAFVCGASLAELRRRGHRGALEWIERFEGRTNEKGKPLPETLARANLHWYEMPTDATADVVVSINPDRKLLFARLSSRAVVNQRAIALSVPAGVSVEVVHMILNSSLGLFYLEAIGFGRGLGALDLSAIRLSERMHILDPRRLRASAEASLRARFAELAKRDILEIDEELTRPERLAFEHELYSAYGIVDHAASIRAALGHLYRIRTAVHR